MKVQRPAKMKPKTLSLMTNKELANYRHFHDWLRKYYGHASRCEFCDAKGKKYQWALVKGKNYERKRENFMELCPSCHRKYDHTEKIRNKMRLAARRLRGKALLQLDDEGNVVKEWETLTDAGRAINTIGSIRTALINGTRSGGYYWKYKLS